MNLGKSVLTASVNCLGCVALLPVTKLAAFELGTMMEVKAVKVPCRADSCCLMLIILVFRSITCDARGHV